MGTSTRHSKKIAAAILLFLMAIPAGLVAARLDGKRLLGPNPLTDWVADRVYDGFIQRIGITDRQLLDMEKLMAPHRRELLAEAVALKNARTALMDSIVQERYDPEAVRQAFDAVATSELDLTLHATELFHQGARVLTPQQRTEALVLYQELKDGAELRFADLEEKLRKTRP